MLANSLKKIIKNKHIQVQTLYKKDFITGAFKKIKRHFDVLLTQTGDDYASSVTDSNLSMYSNMRQFQSFLSKNAYDMAVNNEYDLWPHTNFGTIDNPLIIFSADATWRTVACSGPGSEEESSSHEKMYMIVRAGPINRCMFCGQCFKLLILRDSLNDFTNYYYSSVFTEVSHKVQAENERFPYGSFPFAQHEMQMQAQNVMPTDRQYLFVNGDEADALMVDPAKRLAKYKELDMDFQKYEMVMDEFTRQNKLLRLSDRDKLMIPKDVFERWTEIEAAILTFDKAFNRYEKFEGRAGFDPVNHERRERRMLEKKSVREVDNYTYFMNDLNEQEQMFRDYYESDLEEYPDSTSQTKLKDEAILRNSEDFDMKYIEILEGNVLFNMRAPVETFLENSLFKYRYRKIGDMNYVERNERVVKRFLQRAQNRDENISDNLSDKLEKIIVNGKMNVGLFENLKSGKSHDEYDELAPFAKYVAEEGFLQFRDYYEDDEEEGPMSLKADLWKDINESDKLKFAEVYENHFNQGLEFDKYYVTIPKRPYDNKKSVVSNFLEDLVDFNNRVRPIAKTLSIKDAVSKFQPLPANENENQKKIKGEERYRKILGHTKTGTNLLDEWKKTDEKH